MKIPFIDKHITFQKANQETPTPSLGEVGMNESRILKGITFHDFNPDLLVRTKGLNVYDQMRLDDEVKAALTLKKQAVISPGWDIEPSSEDPRDVEIAEFVEDTLNRIDGTVENMLMQVMTALDYGYSVVEKVWKIQDKGEFKEKIVYKSFKSKKPHNYEFDTDEFGNLKRDGLVLTGIDVNERRLPINKFIIYAHQQEFGNPYGTSDLRSAYRPWWSKDNAVKFWNIALERYGSPLAIGKVKRNTPGAGARLLAILDKIQNKQSLVFNADDFDLDFLEASKNIGKAFDLALAFNNKAISRSILLPDRLSSDGGSGATGSFAMSKSHFDVFLWVVNFLRRELEDKVMFEQIIRPLVDTNFADVDNYPIFKFRPLTDEQKIDLAGAFASAVQKGSITNVTLEDENYTRRVLSYPEAEEIGKDKPPVPPVNPEDEPVEEEPIEPEDDTKAMSFKSQFDNEVNERPLTEPEKSINFQQINDDLTNIQDDSVETLKKTLTKQRDDLTSIVTRKQVNGQLTTKFVEDLSLRFMSEVKAEFKDLTNTTYGQGIKDGKSEIPKKFAVAKQGTEISPTKAISFLTSAAKIDTIVRGIREPLLSASKVILLNAIQTGETTKATVKKLEEAYNPYLADGSVIVDKKQLEAFRLETIVRTTMSEAYNQGRRAVGEDPELEGFVLGYQFSEILDARTTDVSRFVDKKIISVTDPALPQLTYPLHFNERGMFVYVTSDDTPITFMTPAEIGQAIGMKGL